MLEKIRTKGMNPAILSEKKLRKTIKKSDVLKENRQVVTHVFFYGAGCGTENARELLTEVLKSIFDSAHIEVNEDTLAAVYSTINHPKEAAVVCILGTGSNCSYFDGSQEKSRGGMAEVERNIEPPCKLWNTGEEPSKGLRSMH